MNGLMKKLQKIADECVEKQGSAPQLDESMDEFTRLKKKLAFQVKSILSKLKDESFLIYLRLN